MKKFLFRGFLVLIGLVIAAVIVLYFTINTIAANEIESAATESLGVGTSHIAPSSSWTPKAFVESDGRDSVPGCFFFIVGEESTGAVFASLRVLLYAECSN